MKPRIDIGCDRGNECRFDRRDIRPGKPDTDKTGVSSELLRTDATLQDRQRRRDSTSSLSKEEQIPWMSPPETFGRNSSI